MGQTSNFTSKSDGITSKTCFSSHCHLIFSDLVSVCVWPCIFSAMHDK